MYKVDLCLYYEKSEVGSPKTEALLLKACEIR